MSDKQVRRFSVLLITTFILAMLTHTPKIKAASPEYLITFTAALSGLFNAGGIFVMRPDGSDVRQITHFQTPIFDYELHGLNLPDDHPAFSPDGTQIVFTSSRQDFDFELYVMDVNGVNIQRLTHNPGLDIEPVFSPDGSKIAFASERDGRPLAIYVMNADGSNLQLLTDSSLEETEPAWSPDGTQIVFTRVQGDDEKDMFIMNADGSNLRQLTFTPGEDHDGTFSPDGQEIVITSEIAGTRPFGDVFRLRVSDGSYLQNLTASLKQGGGDPAWSPDGSQVAFFKSPLPILVSTQMWVVNADGSNPHKVANQGLINVHPNWGVLADVDNDGTPDYQQGGSIFGDVDLSITLDASPDPVVTGSLLSYQATVRSFGPGVAHGVVGVIFIPAGTTFVSAVADQGSCSSFVIDDAEAIRCDLGDIDPGASVEFTVVVEVDCSLATGDPIENSALVTLSGVDSHSANNSAEMITTALDTPPVITNISVDKPVLWPPNHKMVDVVVNYNVTDNCDPIPLCTLGVTSSESINGTGDGNTAPDWQTVDAHHVRLRAERTGNSNGRVYTIPTTCTDSHENASSQVVEVRVPKGQK